MAGRIDLIFDDDDVSFLNAYDGNGNLLESIVASGDGRGPVPFVTAEISRPDFDIAYIVAGGLNREGGLLDMGVEREDIMLDDFGA